MGMRELDDELSELLGRLDALRETIDRERPIRQDRLGVAIQRLMLEWTYHSNAIEGNSLTYGETRALLLHGVTAQGKPLRDHLDIRGHRAALDFLERFVEGEDDLSLAAIRELHKILLGDTPYEIRAEAPGGGTVMRTVVPGRFKAHPNHVRTATGDVHYYATPEETPALMGDFIDWYRGEWPRVREGEVHPVPFAAEMHHRFVAIHPFDDGNGRIARLLMNLVLMRKGFPPAVIRLENRSAYYGALAQADAGDVSSFARFVGGELEATLELYLRALRGEPDPEAFDRRLALLRRRAETSSRNGGTERSTEALQALANDFLIPYFSRLKAGIDKLGELFNHVDFVGLVRSPSGKNVRTEFPRGLATTEWIGFKGHWRLNGYTLAPDESVTFSYLGTAGAHELRLTRRGGGIRPKPAPIRLTYSGGHSEEAAVQAAARDLEMLVAAVERIQERSESQDD